MSARVSKKTKKPKKSGKKITEKPNREKNRLEFWKNWPVRFGFGFISLKLKKPNRNEPKQKKTKPNRKKNRAKLKKLSQNRAKQKKQSQTEKNRTENNHPLCQPPLNLVAKTMISWWFLKCLGVFSMDQRRV